MSAQGGLFRHRVTGFNLPRFGGGSGTTSTNTVQKADPWSGQQPFLKDVFAQAQGLYNQPGPSYFPSGTVQPMNAGQTTALDTLYGTGITGGTPALTSAQGNVTATNSGDYLNAGNPYFANMAQRTLGQVMPAIQSQFAGAGRSDSGLASRAAAMGATDAVGSLAYQNYADERNNMLKASVIAPQLDQSTMGDINAAYGAAGQYQNQGQQQLNDLVNRWNFQEMQPWQKLGLYSQMVQGNYGGTTTTNQTSPYYSNPLANAIGGIAGIAGIGSSLYNLWPAISAISDRRLKDDIERIGTHSNGLPIYSFRYKGDPVSRVGFMADEVEKVHPEAVMEGYGSYKMVNYALAVLP